MSDLFAHETRHPSAPIALSSERDGRIVARYGYVNEDGTLLYEVVRLEPKSFRQRRPDGSGNWTYNLDGIQREIYRKPQVIQAIAEERHIVVVEGERDVHTLERLGLTATTSPGGSKGWRDRYADVLAGASVVILPDHDVQGRRYARAVATSCLVRGCAVRIVELPNLPEKGDVSDWVEAGGTQDELYRLIEAAPLWLGAVEASDGTPLPSNDDVRGEATGADADEAPPSRFRLYTVAELAMLPRLEPIIDGMYFRNTMATVVATYSAFKTFVVLDQALHITTGRDYHGRRVTRGPVVFVAAEGAHSLPARIEAWRMFNGEADVGSFYVLPQVVTVNNPADLGHLLAELKTLAEKPIAIVLDTFSRTFAGNENLAEDMGTFITACDRIREATGAVIIILHHTGERGGPTEVVLQGRLGAALHRLNPDLLHDTVEEVLRILSRPPHPTLIQNNRWFHALLTDGVEIEYRDAKSGETRGGRARLVDFDNPTANELLVVRQLSVAGPSGKIIRPDLTLFLNGLPLAVIELKDPTDTQADLGVAIDQLERYMQTAPDLFVPNLVLAISDGMLTRVGSITSGRVRFMPWRPLSDDAGGAPTLEAMIRGLFEPRVLVDYLRTCVTFEEDERGEIAKKIAGYHQFRAVRKARASVLASLKPLSGEGDGRGGVIWHTQGSGKSLTMLMLAGALIREPRLTNPTVVMITDRNDLDDQLFDTFAAGRALLRQAPVQAESREQLKALLDRAAGGVVFTTIQKFAEAHGVISERANVVVMADEAHRSQYGFVEGGARWMREALPNATFVGFTGTPLERDDKNTIHVFGQYADVYDIRKAVEDGATRPLYYESRIIKLKVDEAGARVAEEEVEYIVNADGSGEPAGDRIRVPLESLVGAQERVDRLAAFIVEHWEKRRAAMEGKAMVVTMSRDIAARLYEAIRALRPDWHDADDERGAMKVVVTGTSDDPEPLRQHVRTKAARKRLAERFKAPDDDLRLVIVCDMWLTGFDCPPAHTMYLDKPLAGHNLMQAIARVNRVYGDKPGGLIVDLLGLADRLADALATYTQAGGKGEAVRKVQDEAVPAMQAAFEKLRGFFHGCAYEPALDAAPQEVLSVYMSAVDHVFGQADGWKRLRTLVKELSAAFALAVPRPETEAITPHLAFFQRVVAMIRKRLADESDGGAGHARQRDIDAAVRQVIGGAVDADEVIDLFAVAGLEAARLDILSDEFLGRVAALEQKNLALETLRKLLNDQIRITERTNLVQSRKFREALEDAMLRYTNKAITTAEMIARLIDLAKHLREAQKHGEELGLSSEETAFYDALAENGSARDVMKSDTLRLMARELTEMVKHMPKLDWAQRESVRASLRRNVRRLLAKYGYPPDLAEGATQLVLRQAELATAASG